MRVSIQQYLYQNHSWSVVGWNIAEALLKQNHTVDLFPTDNAKKCHLPYNLLPYESNMISSEYDMQISYTAPINWPVYLQKGHKNRFAIWAYEFNGPNILRSDFAKHQKSVDKILAPSNFVKDIFVNSNVDKDKIVVVPHGVHPEQYENKCAYPLKTRKKIKIGLPLGQLHARKNLKGLLTAYYKAFSKHDDVCLVLKIQTQKQQQKQENHAFDLDFYTVFSETKRRFPNGGEVEVVKEFIPDMVEFYNACNIIFTMSNGEGFYMPGLEAMAAGKLVIAPRHGGQLDFMNDDNSLLVEGEIVRAPRNYQYWTQSPYAEMFQPDVEDAVRKLQYAVKNYKQLMEKFRPNMEEQVKKLTWDNVVKQIVGLCE